MEVDITQEEKNKLTGKYILKRLLTPPSPNPDDPLFNDTILYFDGKKIDLNQQIKDFTPGSLDTKPRLQLEGRILESIKTDYEMSLNPENW